MSLPIHVDAYAGHRADERPRRFELDGVEYRIYAWEREWRTPDGRYFLVRAEGKRYILCCDEQSGQWTLESELDGAELLARPNIELLTVEPRAIREAELRIAGCEQCRGDEAYQPFDWILADVLGTGLPRRTSATSKAKRDRGVGATGNKVRVKPRWVGTRDWPAHVE